MKYMLLVCWDAEQMDAQKEPRPTDTPDEKSFPWLDDLQARGTGLTGDQLTPPRRARTVRVRDEKTIVTDGTFVETKEAVGGSTSSSAAAWRRPSRSRPGTRSHRWGRSGPAALGEGRSLLMRKVTSYLANRRALAGSVAGRHRAQRLVAGL